MKLSHNNIYTVLYIFLIYASSCKKLERDNPLDIHYKSSGTPVIKGPNIKFSKYEVYSDNNNDQQINVGESIKLKVYLKNNGTVKANRVKATISCSSIYISALSPINPVSFYNSSYGDYLDSGEEGSASTSSSYLSFNVSNTTPIGTIVTFSLTITDELNNSWSDTFTATVIATSASIGFAKYEVYSDNNSDSQINKGESIKLKVFVRNNGSSRANKVRGTITCTSSYVSALAPANSIGFYNENYSDYLNSGEDGSPSTSSSYLSFIVSNTAPNGTSITFSIIISDESNNTWTDSFTITVVETAAVIKYIRNEVYTDNNNNQQINPGESIKLKVYLLNIGSSRANKIRASISCSSVYISALNPLGSVPFYNSNYSDYLAPGSEGSPYTSSSYLSFNVSAMAPVGSLINFSVSITDESNNAWSDNFTITVN